MPRKKRKVVKSPLQPRSFLADAALDRAIGLAAEAAGMTKSQWIRKALQQQLAFEKITEEAK